MKGYEIQNTKLRFQCYTGTDRWYGILYLIYYRRIKGHPVLFMN